MRLSRDQFEMLVDEALDGLPDHNQELAQVASKAIKNAVKDYLEIKRDPWKKTYRKR